MFKTYIKAIREFDENRNLAISKLIIHLEMKVNLRLNNLPEKTTFAFWTHMQEKD